MESRLFYNVFKHGVSWTIRLLVILIIGGTICTIFSLNPVPTFLVTAIVVEIIDVIYFAISCEWITINISCDLFDKLYDRKFEDYEYTIKEVVYNNGKTYYYPMVKATDYFPLYYIIEDDEKYKLRAYEENKKETKEDALFVIQKFKEQEIRKNNIAYGNKIKEVNTINVNYE